MESKIRLQLLAKQPVVFVNGVTPSLNPQALRLLIYLADTGETEFARDELVRVLYASETPDTRDTFRKRALFTVRKQISDSAVATRGDELILFNAETMWVDSRIFASQARELLQGDPVLRKDDFPTAKAALELYEAPFLASYRPKPSETTDTSRFLRWQKNRQSELETLYQQLLDLVIPYCLEQERTWALAKHYALRWMKSPKPGVKPLQYLIWLAHREQDNSLNSYLAELQTREANGELPIGLSSSEWHRLLKRGLTIPLPRLLSPTDGIVDEVSIPSAEPQTNHDDTLEQILSLLTSQRERRPFAVTGLPGIGKTETARGVVRLLHERHPEYTVVSVELSPQLDLERLTNAILRALGKHDLLSQNYPQKRQRLRQLLQAPNVILILDEGHTTQFADQESLDTTLSLVSGATVMVLARELARFDHYVLELQGLDAPQAADLLVSRKPWLHDVDPLLLHRLIEITRGLPLLLHLVAGGLSRGQDRLQSLIERLTDRTQTSEAGPDIYTTYDRTLSWLWHTIANQDKDLLYALTLFAPTEGANAVEIGIALSGIVPDERLQPQLKHLVEMRLVIEDDRDAAGIRYRLHPIILDFVQRRARRPYAQRIEESYVRYVLKFAASHHDEFTRLDEHQHNIFQTLELVILGEDHQWAQAEAVKVLNDIYRYFEQRGLFSRAGELFTHVRLNIPVESASVRAQLLFHCGKIANTQAQYELALELFAEAYTLEETLGSSQRQGAIFHAIGNIYLHTTQYNLAMESFETAEAWAQRNNQDTLLYSIWSNMGLSMFRQGHFDHAREYYQRVIEGLGEDTRKLPPNLQAVAQHVHNALGLSFSELAKYEDAKFHFQRSMDLARLLDYPELLGQLYLNLGVTYYYMKDYDAAHDCFVHGGRIAEQSQLISLQMEIMWNQGVLAAAQSSYRKAVYLLRSALIAIEENGLGWMKPRILIGLGKVYLGYDHYDAARRCFLDALSCSGISPKHIFQALYGLSLSEILKTHIIGINDVTVTLDLIRPILLSPPISQLSVFSQPSDTSVAFINQAHDVFQRDLDHIPGLSRHRIVEALTGWISGH